MSCAFPHDNGKGGEVISCNGITAAYIVLDTALCARTPFPAQCICWHPNGNYVATGSADRTVRVWDVQSGQCVCMFAGHAGPVLSVAFSPRGDLLASGGTWCRS